MVLNKLNIRSLTAYYDFPTMKRGMQYFNESRVEKIHIGQGTNPPKALIQAIVMGSKRYTVDITLSNDSNETLWIDSDCSCPVGYNCKHVVAALLETIHVRSQQNTPLVDQDEAKSLHWIKSLEETLRDTSRAPEFDAAYELHFVFSDFTLTRLQPCLLEPTLFRRLKSGKLGSKKRMGYHVSSYAKHLLPEEDVLLARLEVMAKLTQNSRGYMHYQLSGKTGQSLLTDLLATGKCFQKKANKTPLTLGPSTSLAIDWELTSTGDQQLQFKTDIKAPVFFFVEGLWYFDKEHCSVGQVHTELNRMVLERLMQAPKIPATQAHAINALMQKQVQLQTLPRLKVILPKEAITCTPIPHLHLKMQAIQWKEWNPGTARSEIKSDTVPVAVLSFKYQQTFITPADQAPIVTQIEGDNLIKIVRDFTAESEANQDLLPYALEPIDTHPRLREHNAAILNYFLFNTVSPLDFATIALPILRQKGWVVAIDEDYGYQVVGIDENDNDSAWFADIDEGETSDWFNLELGISVEGQKVNLLPVINQLLIDLKNVNAIDQLNQKMVYAPLPNGHFAAIPGERIQHIVRSLIELFDHTPLNGDQQLRLSKSQAARLIEIEKALGASQLRWHGGEKLRDLGKKISEFKEISPAVIPSTFEGELRPYQHEGLSWLQFLREYELGGILADDMGLGKTIQALTHLILEKESGRMTSPSLVVAPTSLMYNWEKESKKFAPTLRVAMLHGADRKLLFDQLNDYDLILTTYPLIVRDKEILLKHTFHLLILDEAQYIKNSKSLATQVAIQIKANHRLCLTGTPMENHLGELWSLYHFLMPGLLGEEKFFKRSFRTPIEKNGDNERRQVLNRRLAPFLLRRTKDAVVKELPPKTEIIQYVELDGPQRDLYETIRIAMEEKVRKEVAKLGLSRSHIIILDALLKLRQVCCDPRLLKVDSSMKKAAKSAKMELLTDMLPELIAEGRRILIFSTFTEMLGLIEQLLNELKLPFVKLTGQTKDRKTPIEQFQNGEVPLFLISLKAGGTGLNLTAADTVIHFDPWWNPAAENQATDRAHRIGQDKPVFVYKIVTKGTVEEKIIAMQAKKQALADGIYSDKSTGEAKITENDLKALFAPLC